MFLFVDKDRQMVYKDFFEQFDAECQIFNEALSVLISVQLKKERAAMFDPHIGDCACQIRATLLNMFLFKISNQRLKELISLVAERRKKVQALHEKFNSMSLPFQSGLFIKNSRYSMMDKLHCLSLIYSDVSSFELFVLYYVVVSYILQKFKDDEGLALIKTNSPLGTFFKQSQVTIADLSVNFILSLAEQYEGTTDISAEYLRTLMFKDKVGRTVMPLFLTFEIQWTDWNAKNIPIVFKIVRYYKTKSAPNMICDISINYIVIKNHEIITDPTDLDDEISIVIESSSFDGSFDELNDLRRGKTCLSVNHENFQRIEDPIYKEKITSLNVAEIEQIVRATVADHPQLVSETNTALVEQNLMKLLSETDRLKLVSDANLASSLGCSRKTDISMFAIEHIYGEIVKFVIV